MPGATVGLFTPGQPCAPHATIWATTSDSHWSAVEEHSAEECGPCSSSRGKQTQNLYNNITFYQRSFLTRCVYQSRDPRPNPYFIIFFTRHSCNWHEKTQRVQIWWTGWAGSAQVLITFSPSDTGALQRQNRVHVVTGQACAGWMLTGGWGGGGGWRSRVALC